MLLQWKKMKTVKLQNLNKTMQNGQVVFLLMYIYHMNMCLVNSVKII